MVTSTSGMPLLVCAVFSTFQNLKKSVRKEPHPKNQKSPTQKCRAGLEGIALQTEVRPERLLLAALNHCTRGMATIQRSWEGLATVCVGLCG